MKSTYLQQLNLSSNVYQALQVLNREIDNIETEILEDIIQFLVDKLRERNKN